jgi:hypothetical protein
VECKDNKTHSVRVRARDSAGNDENIAVLNMGYFPAAVLNVFGQADLERSAGGAFSPIAAVTRAGAGAGVTRTLAQISVHSGMSLTSADEAGFSCYDVNHVPYRETQRTKVNGQWATVTIGAAPDFLPPR